MIQGYIEEIMLYSATAGDYAAFISFELCELIIVNWRENRQAKFRNLVSFLDKYGYF